MPYEMTTSEDNLSHVVTFTVSAEDFLKDHKQKLRQLSKRVRLDGFRRGQIPMSVMQHNYGDSVRGEVVEELVNKNIEQFLNTAPRPVLFIGQPELVSMPTAKRALAFTVELEMIPAVEPVGYMGAEVERPVVRVEDAEVEAALEELRESFVTLEPIEDRAVIAEGDHVELDFRALSDEPEVQALQGEDVSIVMGAGQALPGIEEALQGAAFDATLTAKIELEAGFPIPELRGREVELELVIKSVKRRVLPELDDEFAKDTEQAETIQELRATLRQRLVEQRGEEAKRIAQDRLIKSLLEQNSFELPPRFLDQQVREEFQNQLRNLQSQRFDPALLSLGPEGMIAAIREDKVRQIKVEFLLRAIAEEEGVKAEDSDFKAYVAEQAQSMGVGVAELERYLRADADRMAQAQMTIVLNKTLDVLYGEATIKDGEWPAEDEGAEALEAAGEEE